MASVSQFSNKGSFIIACFCIQFLFSSCWPWERMMVEDDIGNLNELSGFLDEIRILEDQVDRMKCDVDFQPSYTSLMQRIDEFQLKYRATVESRTIRPFLYNAVLNRKYNLKYNYESNLIVNITDHLDSVKGDSNFLRLPFDTDRHIFDILNILWLYKEQYELRIQEKMRESNNLVKNFIKPSLEKIEYDVNYKIDSLLAQTIELHNTGKEKEKLTEKEKFLAQALALKELLRSFQLVGHVMSFLSGSVVSAVFHCGRGSTSYQSLYSRVTSNDRDLMAYMETSSELKILEEKIKSVLKPNIQPITEVLDRCYDTVVVYPDKFGNVLFEIHEMKQKIKTGEFNFQEFRNLEDVLQEELYKNRLTLEAEETNESYQNVQTTMIKLKKIIALGNSISNIFQNSGSDTSELQSVENFNDQSETKLEMLKKYEDGIQAMVDKVVSKMKSDIFFTGPLESELYQWKFSPSVANWKIQDFLKETKKIISEMSYLFEAEKEFLNILEGLQETMTAFAEMYDHIQNYLEQKLLFSKIEDMIPFQIIDITNPQFIGAVEELELVIRSNIVLQRYRTAIDAFRLFVFPFASLYIHDLTPLNLNDVGAMAEAVSQIEIVQSRLKLYEQSIRNPSNFITKKEFTSANISSRPFYVWKNHDHQSAIRDLLSGKEILLKADISESPKGLDAIKFEIIGLEFKTRNRNFQFNFTELLKNFKLRGVHLGNSYYRYDSKVYRIPSNSREFDFPFEMKGMTGDIMLSPYASWRFTMVNMTDDADFEELAKYVEEIDLELVGNGFYVTLDEEHENGEYIDLNVDKYYKPVDKEGYNLC